MIVQIYEIQRPQEAEKCIELGVDHLGSILLSEEHWRDPGLRDVFLLTAGTRVKNSLIPLFEDRETLCRALDYYGPDYVHFCETLTDQDGNSIRLENSIQYQINLKEKFPDFGIIRSIPCPPPGVHPNFSAPALALAFEPASDLLLIDTWLGREPVEGFIGITGQTSDWDMARELVAQCKISVLLAGGLCPENVFEALLKVQPAGADSCTWTNEKDEAGRPIRFKKDYLKVERFVKEVRRAESAIALKKQALEAKLEKLRTELEERQKALPAHTIRPHQIMAIEALEEEIDHTEIELKDFKEG